MKRLVQWIQIPEFAPLPVMDRVFEELTDAWNDEGCQVRRITRWEEVEDGGILFLDDAAGRYQEPSVQACHTRLAQLCPNSIVVAWYWINPEYRPFPRMLVTGEHHVYREQVSPVVREYMLRPDFVPLLLRASEAPERIGTYSRPEPLRDYCFMGGGYRRDWLPPEGEYTGLYHQVFYDNYLTYSQRREIYLTSRFALAFQSDENIRTGHLSQRIFEGLAYGCIVFCENPLAAQYTRGAVITITSKEDLWKKMAEWRVASPGQVKAQQERGYDWIRRFGTNRTSAALLWNRIQSRFHVDWDPLLPSPSPSSPPLRTLLSVPVVSIVLMGGLGNQLFQIAAGYTYARRHQAQFHILDRPPVGGRPSYWDSLLIRCRPYLISDLPPLLPWEQGDATVYRPIPPPLPLSSSPGVLLNGYFQTSKYFPSASDRTRIHRLFKPPSEIEHAVQYDYAALLRISHRVVVVHARRTDYITHAAFHGPLPMSYYRKAVDQVRSTVEDPFFLLCSDDPTFWSTLATDLPEVHARPHTILQGETDIRTFALLSHFRHFIISNSTFMWWVVWMAEQRAPANVIAPQKWFGPMGLPNWEDLYEPSWHRCDA